MVYQFTKETRLILRELRVQKKLSQEFVANEIGFSKAYVSQIELGKKPLPSYRSLIKWIEVFNIKPKYFEQLITEKSTKDF